MLREVWPKQPKGCDIFSKIAANTTCSKLLEDYGHILHHNSMPLNSLAIQANDASEGFQSNYLAGTVMRMPGDTIHAGPPRCHSRYRGVFFFTSSEVDGPKYDGHSQWNELSLSVFLLEVLWREFTPNE
jgi:hypothetical protein